MRGVIFGLTPTHSKGHIFRSLLEGTAYFFRWTRETFEQTTNMRIDKAFAVNGGAKSSLWRQILSDVTGITQQYIADSPGAPLGDAIIGAVACGTLHNFNEGIKWINISEKTTPNRGNQANYDHYYMSFKQLCVDLDKRITSA